MAIHPFELEIQAALDGLPADPHAATWSYGEWTLRVKAAVGGVARNRGYEWRSSENGGEFLWDGAALERDAAGNLVSVPLALESEWMGKARIKEDFEKLAASSANHRVMVCSAETLPGVEQHIGRIREYIAAYRNHPGARYLLAGWYGQAHTPGRFTFAVHVC